MTPRRYPVGIQTFSELRTKDMFYVDKTEFVYKMASSSAKYYFLSRPRRFGKSLLVSTLQSYFEGKKELFEGLAIAKQEKDWTQYPVLHFSMAGGKHLEKEQLERYLLYILEINEDKFGVKSDSVDPNVRLLNLITTAYEQTGRQVVVLIDEYDAPLLDVMHEEEMLPVLRNVMRNFYSPLKDCDPMLRFVFLTGITKFSQLSIFSELNNIKNISMDDEYAAVCGITKEEMLEQMDEDIELLAEKNRLTKEQTIDKLKEYYNGYHFTPCSPDVFNPFSLLNCFMDMKFDHYWFASGTPTYLIEMMRRFDTVLTDFAEGIEADRSDFDAPTENLTNIIPLLYQSGYLTIKNYEEDYDVYHLGIPNKEVRIGLTRALLPYYVTGNTPRANTNIRNLARLLNAGKAEEAMQLLADFIGSLPYCDNTSYEGHFQQMLYVIFSLLTRYYIQVEQRIPKGRMDVVIYSQTHVYVIEIKFGKTAAEALAQIDDKNYAKALRITGKPVVEIGINFSVKDERNITEWVIK